ncbi:MAG: hypothetical protein DMG65_07240 [Candidatus Angelobacter sp. Gp1-AA117]|nr:MAG: hypothetical protein DMG65_07240 [Candidatus Angelobacter sp. Gp1-AA117]
MTLIQRLLNSVVEPQPKTFTAEGAEDAEVAKVSLCVFNLALFVPQDFQVAKAGTGRRSEQHEILRRTTRILDIAMQRTQRKANKPRITAMTRILRESEDWVTRIKQPEILCKKQEFWRQQYRGVQGDGH